METAKPFPIYQLMDAFEAFTHGESSAKPQHRSLYYYLLGRARKLGNVPTYTLPYENGMHGSGIGSWATYDAALKALAEWGFITYQPGANRFKAPVVAIQFRNPTDDVLLTYWQSYCLSTCSPIDNSTGDNNRLIELGKKRIKELETSNDAASAAALLTQKKIAELEAQLLVNHSPQSPPVEAPHTGGAADVPTRNEALAEELAESLRSLTACRATIADLRAELDSESKKKGATRVPTSVSRLPFPTQEFAAVWEDFRLTQGIAANSARERVLFKDLQALATIEAEALAIVTQSIRKNWKSFFKLDIPKSNANAPFGHSQGATGSRYNTSAKGTFGGFASRSGSPATQPLGGTDPNKFPG